MAFPSFGVSSSATNTTPASSAATFSTTGFGLASSTPATGSTKSFTGFAVPQTSTPASSSQPQTTSPAFSFSLPSSTSTTTPATSSATTTQTSLVVPSSSGTSTAVAPVAGSPKLPSEITGKTVEEIIKEWNTELQERTGRFRKQANAIAEWDKRILQNRDVLLRLEIEVAKVVETQSSLERQLELIETHQQEVDKALQSMEEEAERIYNDERKSLLDDEAASTRDAMYEQSELVERELEHMTEQIRSIIQSVNANQGGELEAIDGMSPLDVVVRILNNQLSSLMWIDEKAEEFSSRIQKIASQGSSGDRELMAPKHWMS
ncbi:Nucleoporin NSP1-like C-terminal [Arabidopsis suecica]|uniref:Nucleoporin NSP1-like C-terminal n=1 Tax=Arabidopsis suecica TaxID=45249 RepID=A0A8T2AND0_ARASU|nr:Nucleoporin NSP1-like C-terminal [Arabidopsis suecica]